MRIDKQRRPARLTELMYAPLRSKSVTLQLIFAATEHDVLTLGIDVEIAVLAAYGAVAVDHLKRFERLHVNLVLDGSTVAVGFVTNLGWSL